MAKDYAKYVTYRKSRSYRSRFWIILILAIGLLFLGCGIFFMTFHSKHPRQEVRQTEDKLKQKLLESPVPKPPEPEFDFYNILPQDNLTLLPPQPVNNVTLSSVQSNMGEVASISSHLKKRLTGLFSTTPEQVAIAEAKKQLDQEMNQLNNVTYTLILGDFHTISQAEQYQAQALLRGFSVQSRLNKVNGIISYRVFMGPYSELSLATQEKKRLNAAGIAAVLLKSK